MQEIEKYGNIELKEITCSCKKFLFYLSKVGGELNIWQYLRRRSILPET